uniref:IS110 family transposase n=1 Tax=Yersinia frederiksenii TaxID=29484 RepID=UPI001F4BEF30|nr:IS110 family transposase [Yersinia frederiksenii]ULG19896.1 IS110 family transposase [Yersinia frederiksenii]ULG19971.1 IS110 family transposase [Yersinia frederiksenii]
MSKIILIGIDLAKNVFHLHAIDSKGEKVKAAKLSRLKFAEYLYRSEPVIVAMEACASSHYWGRLCSSLGHEARLISPQFVKPFVKSNKNDRNDARAICEAARRADMNFVPVKTVEQQAVLSLHRVREMLIGQRTATINQLRGLLMEFGLPVPTGRQVLLNTLPALLDDLRKISPAFLVTCISQQWEHLKQLELHIDEVTHQIEMHARQSDVARRLQTIPGIGPITASALDAYVGNATQFRAGRQLAAWLGLVPRQHSTGGKPVLMGTSKRGDGYLRQLLVHGARAVVSVVRRSDDPGKQDKTITGWLARKHMNVAVVAMANRNARIAWAVMVHGRSFDNHFREQLAKQLLPA